MDVKPGGGGKPQPIDEEGKYIKKGAADFDFDFDLDELELGEMDDDLKDFSFDDMELYDSLQITEEQKEIIDNLSDIDVLEALKCEIDNIENIDMDKVQNLSVEDTKTLLKAMVYLTNIKNPENTDKDLLALKEKKYEGLWMDIKDPSDYEKLSTNPSPKNPDKSQFDAKMDYFEVAYNGPDKEEKIELLNDFKNKGELYTSLKNEKTKSIKEIKDFISGYLNPESPYSEERKKSS